jgi:hypothetical protein
VLHHGATAESLNSLKLIEIFQINNCIDPNFEGRSQGRIYMNSDCVSLYI